MGLLFSYKDTSSFINKKEASEYKKRMISFGYKSRIKKHPNKNNLFGFKFIVISNK